MDRLRRAAQYMQARLGLPGLLRREFGEDSTVLVRAITEFAGGYFRPIQHEPEIVAALDQVRAHAPGVVLEIGTHWGGSLFLWTRVARPNALIISADLPGGDFGGGYSEIRTPLYQSFARPEQTLHLLRVDSHLASTKEEVVRRLDGRLVDLAFIDGDHTYEGVKQDWEMYSGLVRPGGLVMFHDISSNYDRTQVARFWDELKGGYTHWEYASHPEKLYGIGVLQIPG